MPTNAFQFDLTYWQPFLLAFLPLLINLSVFTYVFLRLPGTRLNVMFLFFIFNLCIWQMLDSITRITSSEEQVRLWYDMFSPFISLVTVLSLHFSLIFANRAKLLGRPWILVLIYAPALFFVLASNGGFITYTIEPDTFWRWRLRLTDEWIPQLNVHWISSLALITLWVFIRYAIEIRNDFERGRQALLIAVGFGVPVVLGIITEVVIPYLLQGNLIPLTSTFMSVFSICVIVAFKKYKLFFYSPRYAWSGIVNNMNEGVMIVDHRDRIKFVNQSFCVMTGYASYELIGKNASDKLLQHQYYKDYVAEAIERRKKMKSDRYEIKLRKKNGEFISCEISGSPYLDKQGNIIGSLGIISDITFRKDTEKELKKYYSQISHKNKVLEQFVYIASHDLQEPLRTVSGFVELLEKKYSDKLDENAKIYLGYIDGATERMQLLVRDLLDYSRIGRKNEYDTVDCNVVLAEVKDDLAQLISETKTEISVAPLPVVPGLKTEIKLLLQNLVVNAIKFRKKGITPQIIITGTEQQGNFRFEIKDNGIGIPEAFHEKIFEVFQRLHTRKEYEGNGIGLAHCKKIVELHGGEIGVISEPEKGSTFYFTLPKMN
ncbi:MAG: sensor histidine kinase [Bacteroidota bacterium]